MDKKARNNGKTSVKNAWPVYVLGIILLTWGILTALSFWAPAGKNGSVLFLIRRTVLGLFGQFAAAGIALTLFTAVKLLTGLYQRVTHKDWSLLLVLFVLLSTFVTLITKMRDTQESLMTFIGARYFPQMDNYRAGYADYLRYAFANQTGVTGMLLAYPLWRYTGQALAGILTMLGILGVLFALCLSPIRQLLKASRARQARRPRNDYVAEEPVAWSAEETPPARPEPVQMAMDPLPLRPQQPPVRYDEPVYDDSFTRGGDVNDGFIPVSGEEMYQEYFPADTYSQPKAGNSMTDVDQLPYHVHLPNESMTPAAADEKPKRNEKKPRPEVPPVKPEEKPKKPAAEPRPEPEQLTEQKPQAEKRPAAVPAPDMSIPVPSVPSGEERPADAQMTEQVLKGAKPVVTGAAVELSNERIPIGGVSAAAPEDAGIDGTPPKVSALKIDVKSSVHYTPPPISLLALGKNNSGVDWAAEDQQRARKIEETLESFNVPCQVKQILHGPAITRFAIQIAQGIRVNKVTNMSDNLALSLATRQVRVEAPIQGTNFIGIEVPNKVISNVYLREVLDSREMRAHPSPLAVGLGKDIAGTPVVCDLSKMPHLLIAGATGSGKSVCIHSIVCSITYRATPEQVRLIMIDPKQVELSVYNALPHLLIPVVTDVRKAAGALAWAVQEMTDRYHRFKESGVRNLDGYNKLFPDEKLPNIVIVIDEMADLMDVCKKEVEEYIRRLAALARAAGIYMVLATQRPSVDVITGVIKNNIPSRIAFAVSSGTDSRTILDQYGAEKLMGKGDMLYKPMGLSPSRVQGCFVSDEEVNSLMTYISRYFSADYNEDLEMQLQNAANNVKGSGTLPLLGGDLEEEANTDASQDDMLPEAIQMALEDGQTSTSMLQRRLRIGYARAGRLVDEMEKLKVVSAQDGSKPRKTIMTREQYYEMMGKQE